MKRDTVDRQAQTKESQDEVDRTGVTAEAEDEVDRNKSTQEDLELQIIFHVHQTEKLALLRRLPSQPMTCAIGQKLIFGRGEGVDIFLNDDSTSRNHMELTTAVRVSRIIFKVTVISQTKPVWINNEKLMFADERILKSNDVVAIGQLVFTVEIISNNVEDDTTQYSLFFNKPHNVQLVPQNLQNPLPQNQPMFHPGINSMQVNFGPSAGVGFMPAGCIAMPMAAPGQFQSNNLFPSAFPSHSFPPYSMPNSQGVSTYNPTRLGHEAHQINAPERREMYAHGQENRERAPSENEEEVIPQNLSVEETEPPM